MTSSPRRRIALPRPASETRRIMQALQAQHPRADTTLRHSDAYQLLVATILSAQCADERVNQVTPALFRRYPDARALARATPADLESKIQSTGFFRVKARALAGMAQALAERHAGVVPRRMQDLIRLPGVGRKTANVVLGHALGVPGLAVDRHVLRVANRLGIARSEDPDRVEEQLCGALPAAVWTTTSDTLILHGRRVCKPRPLCDRCAARGDCTAIRLGLTGIKAETPTGRAGALRRPNGGTARPSRPTRTRRRSP